MLDNLRKNASGWLAKILIALLIASFAAWGVADQFTGGQEQVLASVEDRDITLREFRSVYQSQLNALSRQRGERITTQEAREAGLHGRILDQMVDRTLLDAHARRLGFSVSQDAVTRSVTSSPIFQDSSGEFSRALFERVLRFSNTSEGAYLAQERDALIRSQIAETIARPAEPPETLLSVMNRYRNETRVIAHFNVGPKAIKDQPEPADSKLRSFYDENKDKFLAPETRKVSVLDVTPEALADLVDVSEANVRADYEARRDQYIQPERREIQRITFPDMDTARKGYQALEAGKNFLEVAKQQGLNKSDTELGMLTKTEIVDDKIAEVAFELKKGRYSKPVDGEFSTVILKINEIKPGKRQTFEDVKDEIRKELTKRAASERLLDLRTEIEDERAAGTPLSEIAQTFSLPHKTLTFDRAGNTPDGTQAPAPAQLESFRSAVFNSDVGLDEEPIEKSDEGLLWYEVLEINPAQARPFEQVRDEVEAAWREQQLRQAIVAKASDLAEKARGGKSMEVLATQASATVTRTEPVKRNARLSNLSSAAISRAFTLPAQGVATASATEAPAQTVFKVTQINPPEPPDEDETEQLRRFLQRGLQQDITQQYLGALRSNFDHTVNRDVLNEAFGL